MAPLEQHLRYRGEQKEGCNKITRTGGTTHFRWGRWLILLMLGVVLLPITERDVVAALTLIWPLDPDNRGDLGQGYAQFRP